MECTIIPAIPGASRTVKKGLKQNLEDIARNTKLIYYKSGYTWSIT